MSVQFKPTERVSYDLQATSLVEAAGEIAAMDEAAETEWDPRYTFTTTGETISSAAVAVRTRTRMPRWLGYNAASESDRREWDRFVLALETHERGHIDLVVRCLRSIDQRLVGKSPESAQAVWDGELTDLQSLSDSYD